MLSENAPVVCYGPWDGEWAMFERRCPQCGRLVKADGASNVAELTDSAKPPNATCGRCGRVRMTLVGWTSVEEEST